MSSLADRVKGKQRVKRPYLGLIVAAGPSGGFVVEEAEEDGSAALAGLQRGDEIIGLDGRRPETREAFRELAEAAGVGGIVNVQLVRDGAALTIPMKLAAKKGLSLEIRSIDEVLERKISP